MNHSDAEIEQFSRLAKIWWEKDGELKTLHDINPCRLHYIQQSTTLANREIIDLGCGGGILSEAMALAGAGNVLGIDMSDDCIHVAKQHGEGITNLNYRIAEIESLSETAKSSYDIVTCMEMLEHVPNPKNIIKASKALLKPGGKLFLSTLNRTPTAFFKAIIGAEYLFNIIPRGTHHYKQFIKPSELSHWLREFGFDIKSIKGIDYNPWLRQAQLGNDIRVNYLICAEKTGQ